MENEQDTKNSTREKQKMWKWKTSDTKKQTNDKEKVDRNVDTNRGNRQQLGKDSTKYEQKTKHQTIGQLDGNEKLKLKQLWNNDVRLFNNT